MAVPAQASHLVLVESIEQLDFALEYARQNRLRPLILGEGSNTLFKQDYAGLVILNRLKGIQVLERGGAEVLVKVGAGENWHDWVMHCLKQGWHGLENLALIPGLVGAAPMQNIGAYGVEVKDYLESVEIKNLTDGVVTSLSNRQCEFAYRDSVFKHGLAGKAIVTAVTFRLSTRFVAKLTYPALSKRFEGASSPSAEQLVTAVCSIRTSKLPMPAELPNSGSFFKNPIVSKREFQTLIERYPEIVWFKQDEAVKLAAGWMIEQAGWKSKTSSKVRVHAKQALVIINPDKRPGQEVLSFAEEIQADILKRYQISLEIEPRVY